MSVEREYAYVRTSTADGTVYLQLSNDRRTVSLVAAYLEDGTATRGAADGQEIPVVGRHWGSRVLDDSEVTLARNADGTIARIVDIDPEVRLTSRFEDVTGPHRTRREALDAAAAR